MNQTSKGQITSGLTFTPLGGTGEIGMNLNVYGLDDALLVVDCGMGFAGPEAPEAELLVPDPAFLKANRERIRGLVITHAHEDHIGGIARIWDSLRCPIYATPFTAALIRYRLSEAGLLRTVQIHEIKPGTGFEIAPFSLQYIRMAHSTPEAQALAITTRLGTILHTGDWKLDPEPLVGPPTDEAALQALGDKGVLAMISDSTNAQVEGHSGSEATVRKSMTALIAGLKGRVVVTCFSSNIARIDTVVKAALAADRHVALVGRSLAKYVEAAQEVGYLQDLPDFVPEDEAGRIPDDNLLILATGSQGEKRSALARIAADTHRNIALGEGDTVIFSSRQIPGNERAIGAVQDDLVRAGVNVMTADDHMVHVSGHPARDELRRLYRLVRPKYIIPTHGEWRHMAAQADLAEAEGISTLLLEDGDVVRLGPGEPEVVDSVPVGRLAVDGDRLVPMQGGVMAARRRMMFNGVVVGSIAVDKSGRVKGGAQITAPGLFEADDTALGALEADFVASFEELPASLRTDRGSVKEAAQAALRRVLGRRFGKRPMVDVHVIQVG
ncbi:MULTISPECIES: ribonuclease J [Acidiphilium]|uniref:Ribonuclease J n=1 Tax=Acidiphilium rubrum TaxID=526 RepID=A0A8G2CJT1_ACIRU|nr:MULTISPECIES: ribonuclease J [Acidiphilium]OYV63402.1 MAG: RNase J family beta-CASP ribonuclease [Acidiphilium sp. 21-62-4]OYW04117.1 MAG: RNase J family beta-CASP ribonuclease [Acidiphilium sp. 37-64-53]OZB31053.1 MAG: RNase J family beta-CASP ribonuclease [Acidiphilium sp. 34-64-41]SIQ58603.1 ribonuclease J [Acidiphilium rubrum]HQT83359.1 ribonuclease J [Acidiphilium rubrum]